MLYRVKDKVKKAWFRSRCRDILRTPPISRDGRSDDVIILSGVGNRDVLMYLVAIKSFYHFFNRGRIVLLVQDDCPASNLEVLKHHVNPLRILRDSEVRIGQVSTRRHVGKACLDRARSQGSLCHSTRQRHGYR